MNRMKTFWLFLTLLGFAMLVSLNAVAQEEHDEEHEEESQGPAIISQEMADKVGIKTETAGAGVLHQTVTTYGKLNTPPEQVSHVYARFAGVITSVMARIGDKVEVGTLLAEVESNDSLQQYPIKAPIAGLVTMRHANAGEVTQDQMLFEIANFDPLWAELRVFPSQQKTIKPGKTVFIVLDEQRIQASINHIVPARDGEPYFVARVAVDNSENTLSPGLMAEGHIVTEQFNVALMVKNSAIQTMDDLDGVFVKEGDDVYEFRPVVIGRRDAVATEVLSGIEEGERYVVENSYLIKADIKKSTAEDDD